jgi:DNA (cytosine-5)-methyltransferase 1
MTLTAASCFSGIGAPELGGPKFDWKWCAEIEKFPASVLAKRFPHSVNLGDVTADDFMQRASSYGRLDLLVGGPPCQDFSVAGLRAGMTGDRGNLTLRFLEIAHAIRPRNLLVENVPGWLSMPDNAFGSFLAGLVGADDALRSPLDGKWPSVGMVAGPRARAAWRIFDAQYAGVAQRRRRVFVVADFGDGADPAQILFERKGVFGNHPPSREKGQRPAGTISARTKGGGGLGTDFDLDGGLTPICADIAPTLNAHFGEKQGLEDQHINGGGGLFVTSCQPVSQCRGYVAPRPDFRDTDPNKQVRHRCRSHA